MAEQNKTRLIITVHADKYQDRFKGFSSLNEVLDWPLYRLLLKNYYHAIKNEGSELESYLKTIQLQNPTTGRMTPLAIDDTSFLDKERFINQIINDDNKRLSLIQHLNTTDFFKKKLLKNEDGSIWILPTIHQSYNDENVDFIEKIVDLAQKSCDELYLLLHDKDILATKESIANHMVSKDDSILSKKISTSSSLYRLINDSKVFVFIHSSEDRFFNVIINNDEIGRTGGVNNAIKSMTSTVSNVHSNQDLSYKLASNIQSDTMHKIMSSTTDVYDFSDLFL